MGFLAWMRKERARGVAEREILLREDPKREVERLPMGEANQFTLRGNLFWPELKHVGELETALFKAKIVIPYTDGDGSSRKTYLRITAWDKVAERLGACKEDTLIRVSGHIQERAWTSPTGQRRTFTDLVVTQFSKEQ